MGGRRNGQDGRAAKEEGEMNIALVLLISMLCLMFVFAAVLGIERKNK